MEKYVIKLILLIGLVTMLPGCSILSSRPPPSETFYNVPYQAPNTKLKKPLLNGTLGIARPETDGLHDSVQILFIYSNTPNSIQKHNYHLWADAPSNLIQKRLKDYLTTSGIAKKVVLFEPGENVDYLLRSRIYRMERFVNKDNGKNYDEAIFHLELKVVKANDYQKTIFADKEYGQRVKSERMSSSHKTIYESTVAFGTAFKQVMDLFIQDFLSRKKKKKNKKAKK